MRLTVVLLSTLMLTTEGITRSSIGARLMNGCTSGTAVCAVAKKTGPMAKLTLNASTLSANVVFFIVRFPVWIYASLISYKIRTITSTCKFSYTRIYTNAINTGNARTTQSIANGALLHIGTFCVAVSTHFHTKLVWQFHKQ